MGVLSKILPVVREWIENTFPAPSPIKPHDFKDDPALYLYLCRRPKSPFSIKCPFADLNIQGSSWDILYVGETDKFKNRHIQHIAQVETCEKHKLVNLIYSALATSPCADVDEVDLSSDVFVEAIKNRQREFGYDPKGKTPYQDCKRSIGWSLAEFVTFIPSDDIRTRVRTEQVLVATLKPPLNWMRR